MPDTNALQQTRDGLTSMLYARPSQRQVSLHKFVRHAGDLLPAPLFVPYLDMLRGLATGAKSACCCYNMLKENGTGLRYTTLI